MYLNNASCPCGVHGSSLVIASYIPNPTPRVLLYSLRDHSFPFDIARLSLADISCSLPVVSHTSRSHVAELLSTHLRSVPWNRRPCSFLSLHPTSFPPILSSPPLSLSAIPLGQHLTYRSHLTYNDITVDCSIVTELALVRVAMTATEIKWFGAGLCPRTEGITNEENFHTTTSSYSAGFGHQDNTSLDPYFGCPVVLTFPKR